MKRTKIIGLIALLLLAQTPVLAEEGNTTPSTSSSSSSTASSSEETNSSSSNDSTASSADATKPSASSSPEEQASSSKTDTESDSKTSSAEEEPVSKAVSKENEDKAGLKEEKKEGEEEGEFVVSVNQSTQDFIKKIAEDSRTIGQEQKLYASVMIAQAILESGSGNSGLAQAPYYNLFGIKGAYQGQSVEMSTKEDDGSGKLHTIKAAFRKYPSYRASLKDYAALLRTPLYRGAWKEVAGTYQEATKSLTGKYATDTRYDKKLNALIEAYQLTQYDEPTEKTLLERYPEGDYPDYDGKDYPGAENYNESSARYSFNRMSQLGGKFESNFELPLNWIDKASSQGYIVSQEPKVGTAVVLKAKQEKAGVQGQIAIVEKVYPSGAILISEYSKVSDKLLSFRVIDSDKAKELYYITPKSPKDTENQPED